ncbi:hypothetical protein DIPPA_19885 [Diplonema papillatum]|nr:hypothetical protein DIPPA_19885 [Diplonema papillatum]
MATEEQKAYLRKHDVAIILDAAVRELLEEKPSAPFDFVVQKLQEHLAKSSPGEEKTKEEEKVASSGEKPDAATDAAGASKDAEPEVIDLSTLDQEDRQKIIKIQAQYRGVKARGEVAKLKDSQPAAEAKEKGEPPAAEAAAAVAPAGDDGKAEGGEEVVDLSTWSKEDKESLVKIQARYRGVKGREKAEKTKQDAPEGEPSKKAEDTKNAGEKQEAADGAGKEAEEADSKKAGEAEAAEAPKKADAPKEEEKAVSTNEEAKAEATKEEAEKEEASADAKAEATKEEPAAEEGGEKDAAPEGPPTQPAADGAAEQKEAAEPAKEE